MYPNEDCFNVAEFLFMQRGCFGHILQEVLFNLDGGTLSNLRLASKDMKEFVDRRVWMNKRGKRVMRNKLSRSWQLPPSSESDLAFQCSEDVFDLKIRGESVICGLRNGTIEIWNRITLKREHSLQDQHGSVQVDANDEIVVGVSSDSTVCIWCRKTGVLKDVLYHHRASVWGVQLQGDVIVTGSMDGTIALIDAKTLSLKKHFMAHEGEWGVSEIDTTPHVIVSGSFGHHIRVWSFPSCTLLRSIDAPHAVNCVSVHGNIIASCSRTGKTAGGVANVILWDMETGEALRKMEMPSACYVRLDCDKLVALVAAGDAIIGEHHMIKWPIAKIVILTRPDIHDHHHHHHNNNNNNNNTNNNNNNNKRISQWDEKKNRAEILLRYQRTPSVTCDRTMLVYSQSRTPGMCSVVKYWK